jgi:hypothetical protein
MEAAFGTHVSNSYLKFQDRDVELIVPLGFDRDLGVAGRVMVRNKDGSIEQKLIKIDRPSRNPSLPIFGYDC